MNIEGLKEQARRHEQKEEWKKALDLYARAIARLEEEDQPDVSLHNRVGDLCVRVGDLDRATRHYEQAVDLYVEAELPNNAIAVCKKVIRNVPTRHAVYLRMGRIRAQQGFLTDARQNFLTYAERIQAGGNLEEALRALEELADLFPGDMEIHLSLAAQLQAHGRSEEALAQLEAAYRAAIAAGDQPSADATAAKAKEIDPSVDFVRRSAEREAATGASAAEEDAAEGFELGSSVPEDAEASFTEIAHGSDEPPSFETASGEQPSDEPRFSVDDDVLQLDVPSHAESEALLASLTLPKGEPTTEGHEAEDELEAIGVVDLDAELEVLEAFQLSPEAEGAGTEDTDDGEVDDDAFPLPLLDLEPGDPQPLLDTDAVFRQQGGGAGAGPSFIVEPPAARDGSGARVGEGEGPAWGTPAAGVPEELIAAGDLAGAEQALRRMMVEEPMELAHRQRLVEVAYRKGDPRAQAEAYVELARCLERNGSGRQAGGVYQQVLQLDPENAIARAALAGSQPTLPDVAQVASSDDYVDLGSLIFDDEEEEKTTRFLVAYEEPTGDEEADFARMLSQFKAKIAQNVAADDVRAHHDLGTAYKEMGLLAEAIEEFQAALRASRDHLPTYELLGQCFLEKGEPEAAIKALRRALALQIEVEDELLGIYYFLGRAYQKTGDNEAAVEFYDRVFSLDINFMDVTERLRALR